MLFILYLSLAIMVFSFVYKRTRDALHPIAVLPAIWFLTAAISSLQLGDYQTSWLLETHIMVILSGLAYVAAGISVANPRDDARNNEFRINDTYRLLTRFLFIFCVSVTAKIFISRGMDLSFFMRISGADLKTEVASGLSTISSVETYIINFLPFCALFSGFELSYSEREDRHLIYNVLVIAVAVTYCLFILHSRGTLLYIILGAIFILNCKKQISIRYLFLAGAGVVVALGLIMMNRVFHESIVYSGVEGVNNLVLSSTYNYIVYCFQNFNEIVEEGSRYNILANVGQSLYKVLGIYDDGSIIRHEVANVFNAVGWLSPFYDDLGFLGTLFYPGIIGCILARFYNGIRTNKYYVLVLASLQKAIYMAFFGNYFLSAFSVMLPYILIGAVCVLSSKVNVAYPKIRFRPPENNIAKSKVRIRILR